MRAVILNDSQNRIHQHIQSNYKHGLPHQRTPSKHQIYRKKKTSLKIKEGTDQVEAIQKQDDI